MGFRIKRSSENRQVRAIIQNIADIPGGVTVSVADLVAGRPLLDGTPVGKGSDGMYHVVKSAKVVEAAASTAKNYKVDKANHFKVGDVITTAVGGPAYAITAIDRDSSSTYDTLTVGTTIGAAAIGAVIEQATAAAAESTALKYAPIALVGEPKDVESNDNLWVPAIVIGTFKSDVVPPMGSDITSALKGIVLL